MQFWFHQSNIYHLIDIYSYVINCLIAFPLVCMYPVLHRRARVCRLPSYVISVLLSRLRCPLVDGLLTSCVTHFSVLYCHGQRSYCSLSSIYLLWIFQIGTAIVQSELQTITPFRLDCPDVVSLVVDTLLGNGFGSPIQIQFQLFYVYGSVHHNIFYEITNRCSYMQAILFHCQVHSTFFAGVLHTHHQEYNL